MHQQHADAAVDHHVGQSLGRIGTVQRHVGGARLEDAQERHHHVQRALQAQADPRLGADAARPQEVGEPMGPLHQLRVREGAALRGHHRQGIGRARRLGLDERGDAGVAGRSLARRIPLHHHPLLLLGGQQGQRPHPRLRCPDGALQQHLQVAQQALQGGRVEEVRVVEGLQPHPLGSADERHRQLQLRGGGHRLQRLHVQARKGQPRQGGVELIEEHLEARRAAAQGLEGHVRMGEALQHRVAGAREQFAKRGVSGQVGAEDEGLEEEAHDAIEARLPAVCEGRAHQEVLLPAVARQQHLQARQHGHEQGSRLLAGQRLQAPHQRGGQQHLAQPGAPGARAARPVRGQLQRQRRVRQVLTPPGALSLQRLAMERGALPGGVVGVLEGGLGHGRLRARVEGRVERSQLADQDSRGPAIDDEVVQRHQQHVLTFAQPQQGDAQQWTAREVERAVRVLAQQPPHLGLTLGGGQCPQVDRSEREDGGGRADLEGLASLGMEGRPQHLMAAHQLAQAVLQGRDVERTRELQRGGQVVGEAAWLELLEQPHPLLGEGQRRRAALLAAGDADAGLLLTPTRQQLVGGGGQRRVPPQEGRGQ